MAEVERDPFRRADPGASARRDRERRQRRDEGRGFWRSIALVGSVGWPIVGLATAGAIGGWLMDRHFHTGVRFALLFVTLGATLGTWAAFRTIRGGGGSA